MIPEVCICRHVPRGLVWKRTEHLQLAIMWRKKVFLRQSPTNSCCFIKEYIHRMYRWGWRPAGPTHPSFGVLRKKHVFILFAWMCDSRWSWGWIGHGPVRCVSRRVCSSLQCYSYYHGDVCSPFSRAVEALKWEDCGTNKVEPPSFQLSLWQTLSRSLSGSREANRAVPCHCGCVRLSNSPRKAVKRLTLASSGKGYWRTSTRCFLFLSENHPLQALIIQSWYFCTI